MFQPNKRHLNRYNVWSVSLLDTIYKSTEQTVWSVDISLNRTTYISTDSTLNSTEQPTFQPITFIKFNRTTYISTDSFQILTGRDNNCLFRSVLSLVSVGEAKYSPQMLRLQMLREMGEHPETYFVSMQKSWILRFQILITNKLTTYANNDHIVIVATYQNWLGRCRCWLQYLQEMGHQDDKCWGGMWYDRGQVSLHTLKGIYFT